MNPFKPEEKTRVNAYGRVGENLKFAMRGFARKDDLASYEALLDVYEIEGAEREDAIAAFRALCRELRG